MDRYTFVYSKIWVQVIGIAEFVSQSKSESPVPISSIFRVKNFSYLGPTVVFDCCWLTCQNLTISNPRWKNLLSCLASLIMDLRYTFGIRPKIIHFIDFCLSLSFLRYIKSFLHCIYRLADCFGQDIWNIWNTLKTRVLNCLIYCWNWSDTSLIKHFLCLLLSSLIHELKWSVDWINWIWRY